MISLLWYMIPIALAIALSIIPIMAVIMLLLSANPLKRSVPFAIAWAAGLFILVTLFSYGSGSLPQGVLSSGVPWAHTAELVIGVVLLAYGLISGIKSVKHSKTDEESGLVRAIDKMGPFQSVLFGLALNLRPKNLILVIAAAVALSGAHLPWGEVLLTTVLFVIVASSGVSVLVIIYAVGQDRAKPVLEKVKTFLDNHSATMVSFILATVGIALIVIAAVAIWK